MNANLKEVINYSNSILPEDKTDFLLSSGFSFYIRKDELHFYKNQKFHLTVKGNSFDLFKFIPDSNITDSLSWKFKFSFTGIDNLSFTEWAQLMHVMQVISLLRPAVIVSPEKTNS
jgi:hypothetical protein